MRCWLFFLLWLGLVGGAIVCADRGWLRALFLWMEQYPGLDKAGHFVLIGTLAFLLNQSLATRSVPLGRFRLQLGGLLVAVAMTIEEFSQLWFPGRTFDLLDLTANYAGIIAAGLLTRRLAHGATDEASPAVD